jgi:methionyl-tRNA formyltransferase
MKINILCDNKLAMPAIQKLLDAKKVAAIGITDRKIDVVQVFTHLAKRYGLPLQIFIKKNFPAQLQSWLAAHTPDVVLVMTYPFKIPASALKVPRHGFINFHYGLLPEMRGADPIFESIRQRKTIAGTTVHIMDEGLDTGPIIMREEIPCEPHYTYGMLSARLAGQGEKMAIKLIGMLESGNPVETVPQDESKAAYYPALTDKGIYLDWNNMDGESLVALINSCNPLSKNGVPTIVNGWTIGVCDATIIALTGDASAYTPGMILAVDGQNGLVVKTNDTNAIRLAVIYTEEGYFPGWKLSNFGIAPGMSFVMP